MIALDNIEFPSKFLSCYESVLMTLLKHQGVHEEAALMGTQAYFAFDPTTFTVSPKYSSVDAAWQRLYGYRVHTETVADAAALQRQVCARLHDDVPVCLPVDLYALPHTLHHQQLHQHHYVTLFGYENGRYYMVCPYYRFQDWVDADLIHNGFFSAVVATKGAYLITLANVSPPRLSAEQLTALIEDNCRYMLNLDTPATTTAVSPNVGISGLRTFAHAFQQRASQEQSSVTHKTAYINLSRHLTAVSHARYWFHQLIQTHDPALLSTDLQTQFADVIQAWKAVGIRLGMGVHGQRPELIQRVASSLATMHTQEVRLFNTLLGALPTYEQGTL